MDHGTESNKKNSLENKQNRFFTLTHLSLHHLDVIQTRVIKVESFATFGQVAPFSEDSSSPNVFRVCVRFHGPMWNKRRRTEAYRHAACGEVVVNTHTHKPKLSEQEVFYLRRASRRKRWRKIRLDCNVHSFILSTCLVRVVEVILAY